MNEKNLGTTFRPSNVARPEYPADLLKFIACKKPAENLSSAVNLIVDKKLVLGEPAVVPFYYIHNKEPKITDPSTGELVFKKTIELLFAIGSLDPNNPFMNVTNNNIDTHVYNIINDAKIVDANGIDKALIDVLNAITAKFNNYVKKTEIETEIIKAFDNNPQLVEKVADRVIVNPKMEEKITQSVETKIAPITKEIVTLKTDVSEIQEHIGWKDMPKI